MSTIKRGALIVIEGLDRSGKSTQCKKIIHSLEKHSIPAELISFPDRTSLTGQLIDKYLKNTNCQLADEAVHLLFTSNRWEKHEQMKQLLNKGVTLIVDRYSYSGIVYSAIKKNMNLNWCMQPENGLLKPDIVFLLNLTAEELSQRSGFGDERYENVAVQLKVAEMFQKIASQQDNWKIIDASRTIDEVHSELYDDVMDILKTACTSPLNVLQF